MFNSTKKKEKARMFLAKKNDDCWTNLIWTQGQTLIEGTYKIQQPDREVSETK